MSKKQMISRLVSVAAAIGLLAIGINAYSSQSGVKDAIHGATAPFEDGQRIDWVLEPTEKTVRVKQPYQGGVFYTTTRKDRMERFACSRCHNNSDVKVPAAAAVAHGEIMLDHGGKDKPLACFTCHKQDARDKLVTEADTVIDMDHSYRLCGQCHFRQKDDWVGGAHGKRVSNWAGKRVVNNCTACHDPHQPRFAKRWPKIYSPPRD